MNDLDVLSEVKKIMDEKNATTFNVIDVQEATKRIKRKEILVHPSCVISRDKYAYMKLFTPGSDSRTADKYVYQNRYYTDTFLIERKSCGIAINAEAEG